MPFPETYPACRDWSANASVELRDFPAIDAAWRNSRQILTDMGQRLADAHLDADVLTVAASGSLGRMEAVAGSDADLIIVLRDGILADSPQGRHACDAVWAALEPLQIQRSRSGGIFAIPTTPAALCHPAARGRIDEDLPTFGKRFQLLCDTQPIYGAAAYEQLLANVIAWYTAAPPDQPSVPWWQYLLNDLIRYYRSLCAAAQWDRSQTAGFMRMRRFKLAHSRTVMYAALLCALGECSQAAGVPQRQLHAALHLTPLERLAWSYAAAQDAGILTVTAVINRYLDALGDTEFRRALVDDASVTAILQTGGAEILSRELSRFLNAQQPRWNEDFAAGLWL